MVNQQPARDQFFRQQIYIPMKQREQAEASQQDQKPLSLEDGKQAHGAPLWIAEGRLAVSETTNRIGNALGVVDVPRPDNSD